MALLAAGDYRAKALEAQLTYTSKGTEQIAVRFSLLDFPAQTITWFGYLSEAAFEIAMRGLRAAGKPHGHGLAPGPRLPGKIEL